jgi:hypothetical protein
MNNTEEKAQLVEYCHTYEIMAHPQRELSNVKILKKDGIPCKCHKVPNQIVATQIEGQYAKEYENCSTHCTRAQIVKQGDDLFFFQTCEAIPQKYKLANAEAKPKSPLEVVR